MTTSSARFTGRKALVTGGASGIGLATARRLAQEGAAVSILDARGDAALEAAESVRAAVAGARVVGIACDVSNESSVVDAVGRTSAELGGIDVAVTCAGIARHGVFHQLTLDEWSSVIGVNLDGTFLPLKHAIPHMLEAGRGAIVTIGSVASLVAAGRSASYEASKGGVLLLTKAIAVEYVDRNIRANCVCPGLVATGLGANTVALHGKSSTESTAHASRVRVPMERAADPSEIAAAVAFLCSDEASFLTGAAIPVDGGYTAI